MNENLERKINSLEGVVGRLTYGGATIHKTERKISVVFNSSFAQPKHVAESLRVLLVEELPHSFSSVEVNVRKIVTEPEFVAKAVTSFFEKNHKVICSAIAEGGVELVRGDKVAVTISCENTAYEFCVKNGVKERLESFLEGEFADEFVVSFVDTGYVEADESKLAVTPVRVPEERPVRTLKVEDVTKYLDEDPTDEASYIVDAKEKLGEFYLAGTIQSVREAETSNGKPYFTIDFSDRTAVASGVIFPNKDKVAKLRKLAPQVDVIVRGEFYLHKGYKNFRIYNVNLCVFPKNFVPVERPKRKVAESYSLVFPKPYEYEKQENFLSDDSAPKCFNDRTFVVFDLETTGTNFDDKITEIGAVKIIDGKITEYFTTLVNPQKHIPKDVVELTGIDDDLVKNAPLFEDVCSDFYKFCYGATLVGHNVEFDLRFIKNQSKQLDYLYENTYMDTLLLSKQILEGMTNYKLNTVCDFFGIKFRHHRAMSDAAATAELFVELIRKKGSMPF